MADQKGESLSTAASTEGLFLYGWDDTDDLKVPASLIAPSAVIYAASLGYGSATASENVAALTAAIALLDGTGGEIRLPPGRFNLDSGISLQGKTSIRIVGEGDYGLQDDYGSMMVFTQGGSGRMVDMRGTSTCFLEQMTVAYTSQTFSGTVIDMSTPGVSCGLRDVTVYQFGGSSYTAAALVDTDGMVAGVFERCYFGCAVDLIKGYDPAGTGYANVMSFRDCTFINWTHAAVYRPNMSWSFESCVWEMLAGKKPAILGSSGSFIRNLNINNAWCGDTTDDVTIFDLYNVEGLSLTGSLLDGLSISGATAGSVGVALRGTCKAINVAGNTITNFEEGVSFAVATDGAVVMANDFAGCHFGLSGLTNVTRLYALANTPDDVFVNRALPVQGLTVANLPVATEPYRLQFVTDDVLGSCLAFSDGTNWRRVADRQVVGTSPKVSYSTGIGAAGPTQATNKSTGVTLNKSSGRITMNGAALAAGAIVSFVLTNSAIVAGDLMTINHVSGGTLGAYTFNAVCANGSATIYVRNATAGSLSEAIVIDFGT